MEPLPLLSEVEKAIKDMKSQKSPGIDEIPAELLKYSGEERIRLLHHLCCLIWKSLEWPQDWTKSLFITIPKKGDPAVWK